MILKGGPKPICTPQMTELLKVYTKEYCLRLLTADPEGCYRLYQIGREEPVKLNYALGHQLKSRKTL